MKLSVSVYFVDSAEVSVCVLLMAEDSGFFYIFSMASISVSTSHSKTSLELTKKSNSVERGKNNTKRRL